MMKLVTIPKHKCGLYLKEIVKYKIDKKGNQIPIGFEKVPLLDFGTIDKKIGVDLKNGECLQDLQEGDLYCFRSDLYEINGIKFIVLIGNGWAEQLGFPYDEQMKRYPIISGKTSERMIQDANRDEFGYWDKVFSGDINDLYSW